jgi:hypothetical protein
LGGPISHTYQAAAGHNTVCLAVLTVVVRQTVVADADAAVFVAAAVDAVDAADAADAVDAVDAAGAADAADGADGAGADADADADVDAGAGAADHEDVLLANPVMAVGKLLYRSRQGCNFWEDLGHEDLALRQAYWHIEGS